MKILKLEKNNCTPCKMVGQFLDSKGINYEIGNIDDNPELIDLYDLMGVPVVIRFDDEGNEVDRVVGFDINKLEEIVK